MNRILVSISRLSSPWVEHYWLRPRFRQPLIRQRLVVSGLT